MSPSVLLWPGVKRRWILSSEMGGGPKGQGPGRLGELLGHTRPSRRSADTAGSPVTYQGTITYTIGCHIICNRRLSYIYSRKPCCIRSESLLHTQKDCILFVIAGSIIYTTRSPVTYNRRHRKNKIKKHIHIYICMCILMCIYIYNRIPYCI